jgi:hypothetical protein
MPPTRSQANRPVAIATPLGDAVLLFVRMTARGIKPEDLLGQNVTIRSIDGTKALLTEESLKPAAGAGRRLSTYFSTPFSRQ